MIKIDQERLKRLERGVTVDGVKYGSIKVEVEVEKPSNSWLKISLTEGKNREIRKVMEHFGLQVNRLIRTSYGEFKLGNLSVGEVIEVRRNIVNQIMNSSTKA